MSRTNRTGCISALKGVGRHIHGLSLRPLSHGEINYRAIILANSGTKRRRSEIKLDLVEATGISAGQFRAEQGSRLPSFRQQ